MLSKNPFLGKAAVVMLAAAAAGLVTGAVWHSGSSRKTPQASASAPSTAQPGPSDSAAPSPSEASGSFTVQADTTSASPGQKITLTGQAPGVSGGQLQVQQQQNGSWVNFPATAVTRSDGSFSTYVVFQRPGERVLRLTTPDGSQSSNPVTITVN